MTNVTTLKPRKAKDKSEHAQPILDRMRAGEISMKDAAIELMTACNYSIDQAWRAAKHAHNG